MMSEGQKKSDNSLLFLEKKLENGSTDEIILNKFKLKPNIGADSHKGKEFIKNIASFLDDFKKSTDELVNNPELVEKNNIENKESKVSQDSKNNKFVKMNLALGVLDLKEKEGEMDIDQIEQGEEILKNIIQMKNSANNVSQEDESMNMIVNDQMDLNILEFLSHNKKKKNKKLGKVKKNKK